MLIGELDAFLGRKIRFYRSKYRWPLKTLADEIGVSLQQLQRYEQGENKICATLIYKFACVFKIKVDAFYEGFDLAGSEEQVTEARETSY